MLMSFEVTNHLSIRSRQQLLLTASSALKDNAENLLDCPASPSGKIVPAVVIYGANASGKTSIINSLIFMREFVENSHSRKDSSGPISRDFFALDAGCENEPTEFIINFFLEGVRYRYDFSILADKVRSENLLYYPRGRRKVLFTRTYQSFLFGRSLRGRNRVISDLTRPNSLFVSAAAQNDHEQITKIYKYISSIRSISTISVPGEIASLPFRGGGMDKRIVDFLGKIGTGIVEFRTKEEEYSDMMKEIMNSVAGITKKYQQSSVIEDDFLEKIGKDFEIEFGHSAKNDSTVFLSLSRESAGTRRLLLVLQQIFFALDNGSVLLIDEFDASLHTQACEELLSLFLNGESNKNGGQIVVTTHDTNLLSSKLLRRDQIWFTEKDLVGATHLYSLSDFRTRRGDNIEKGYLQGRFGAIPFAGRLGQFLDK